MNWSQLKEKFNLVKTIYRLRKEVKEEKRLKDVYFCLCDDKTKEIDTLRRELKLIWDVYGVGYKTRIDGLQSLLEEVKESV